MILPTTFSSRVPFLLSGNHNILYMLVLYSDEKEQSMRYSNIVFIVLSSHYITSHHVVIIMISKQARRRRRRRRKKCSNKWHDDDDEASASYHHHHHHHIVNRASYNTGIMFVFKDEPSHPSRILLIHSSLIFIRIMSIIQVISHAPRCCRDSRRIEDCNQR